MNPSRKKVAKEIFDEKIDYLEHLLRNCQIRNKQLISQIEKEKERTRIIDCNVGDIYIRLPSDRKNIMIAKELLEILEQELKKKFGVK